MRIQSERESEAVKQERSLLVFKRDDLIQKSRYSLTVQEQRIVLYAMSKIKPTDDAFQEYTFFYTSNLYYFIWASSQLKKMK